MITLFSGDYWEIGEIYLEAVGFLLPDFIGGFDTAHLGDGFGVIQHSGMAHDFNGFFTVWFCTDTGGITQRKMPSGTWGTQSVCQRQIFERIISITFIQACRTTKSAAWAFPASAALDR